MTTLRAVRVGVIGTGFGGRVVAPTFAATDGCEVVDVVSARDEGAVAALCRRGDVDLVSVHSPPFLHVRHVAVALDAGHAVLCDKPFGTTAGDAETMLAAAESAGVVHLVNFEFRCDPSRLQMQEWLRDGVIGPVEHASWIHLSAGTRIPLRPFGWLFQRAAGGGWIGAWASHAVDTVRFVLGTEITDVRASRSTTIEQRPDRDGNLQKCDAEDTLVAVLRTASGATVVIDSGFAAPASLPPRLVMMGEKGAIENVADTRLVLRATDRRDERTYGAEREADRHAGPMARWAAVVRDAVRDGVAPPDAPTFTDGVACARVLDALRTSPPAP
jgi:predicted dehydrogenase